MTGIEEFFAADAAATAAASTSAEVAADVAASAEAASIAAGSTASAGALAAAAAPAASAGLSTGSILSLVGTGFSALQQLMAGNAAKGAGKYNQQAANQQALAEEAAAQRTMIARNKQTALTLSRTRALAAAGGGSAGDPGVVNLEGQIAGQGEYNAMTDLYNGESRATALRSGGVLASNQGDVADYTSNIKAGSTIMSGASSLFTRYAPDPLANYNAGLA